MITTDSSTPCCTNKRLLPTEQGAQRRALCVVLIVSSLFPQVALAQADAPSEQSVPITDEQGAASDGDQVEHSEQEAPAVPPRRAERFQLQRMGDSLLLSVSLIWELPHLVEEALMKGVPVHFIAEAKIIRERWYWSDQVLLNAYRYMRLSYQPLTRRWRLYTGSTPFEGRGLGMALAASYDSLEDALNAMRRIARWNLGSTADLPDEGSALLEVVFRIDLSQFPRPLQIGALGRSDWNLLVTQKKNISLDSI